MVLKGLFPSGHGHGDEVYDLPPARTHSLDKDELRTARTGERKRLCPSQAGLAAFAHMDSSGCLSLSSFSILVKRPSLSISRRWVECDGLRERRGEFRISLAGDNPFVG